MILMTPESELALFGLRDLTMIKWYVIPLLALVMYIYIIEIEKARETGNWNAIYAGVIYFGVDFINETWNGMVFAATQNSAFWTTPGETALRTMVGWNIEIMFMFAIAGIVFAHSLPNMEDPFERMNILGKKIPSCWVNGFAFAWFCVFIECILNMGGHLVWEYPWWNLSIGGIWLIFFIGYFNFYIACIFIWWLDDDKHKKLFIAIVYGVAIGLNIVFMGILGWVY